MLYVASLLLSLIALTRASDSHYAYPTWLPAPRVRYAHLRSALDVYGRAEMRLGR